MGIGIVRVGGIHMYVEILVNLETPEALEKSENLLS